MKNISPPLAAPYLALILLLPLLACGAGPGAAPTEGMAREGSAVPSFRLASLDGGEVGPEDLAGQVQVYEFWATWCPPCHEQASILRSVVPEFEGRGVRFFAVDVGEPEATVRQFVERNPFPYSVLIDPEDELSWELGIEALPTLLVVDREGTVSYFRPGVLEADGVRRVLSAAGVA